MGRVIRKVAELRHNKKWNAFDDAPRDSGYGGGYTMSPRNSGNPARYYSDRSWIGSILTRMAVDFSQVDFFHAKMDPVNDVAVEVIRDSLHQCLTLSPNIDQDAQALKIDYALTLFRYGHAVVVPVECDMDPLKTGSYEIGQLRVGTVAAWHARKVTVEVYDDREVDASGEPVNGGIRKQMTLPKDMVMYQENPFYGIMNEPSGLVQRYMRKLEILDELDEAAVSGDLDMILQLPYTVRGESRQKVAEERRKELSDQLKNDPLGIGYIDISEKVIQLNRPIENKILDQVEWLANRILGEFGLTDSVMNGSATQDQVNMYYDRTINPIAYGFALEAKRKFLTKTAVTQRHSIETYRDPLKNVPASELAELVDKLLRNAAITANELRPKIGYMPSKDPRANQLANPNMPADDQVNSSVPEKPEEVTDG